MPTLVKLYLRADGSGDEVDLDTLTPRARALAEAVHQGPLDVCIESDTLLRDRLPDWEIWTTPERAAQPESGIWRHWTKYPADSTMSLAEYLELEAAKLEPGWHFVGGHFSTPVPSVAAGAADDHMSKDYAMEYLARRGAPFSPMGWDTLRGTAHGPVPDRYVFRRPQWRPATLDAYLARDFERWSVSRVAEYLGYGGTAQAAASSARRQLTRWGLLPVDRQPGRAGQNRYASDQVIACHEARPGRGRWSQSRK